MQKYLIQSDPAIMMGKPVIAGTRITVESILEKLAAGEGIKHIMEEHPRLSKEKIRAALAFASAALRADVGERGRWGHGSVGVSGCGGFYAESLK